MVAYRALRRAPEEQAIEADRGSVTVAAIYMPSPGRDPHMHAWTGCTYGKIRIIEHGKYRVNTAQFAQELGKKPCPDCWTTFGYRFDWERGEVR